jgi:hypothetical protein
MCFSVFSDWVLVGNEETLFKVKFSVRNGAAKLHPDE